MRKHEFYRSLPRDRLRELVSRSRLPAFFYFTDLIEANITAVSHALPQGFHLHYACKANPHPGILQFMSSRGLGADVASLGELTLALHAGFSPDLIEFTGPGKTAAEIAMAVDSGIASINAESVGELREIIRHCRGAGKTARVGLRINPRAGRSQAAMRMGGDTQFGIIEDDLEQAVGLLRAASEQIRFSGFHLHLGSQFMRAEQIIANYRFILEKVAEVSRRFDLRPESVNCGGGWGVDMFGRKEPLDLVALREGLIPLFSDLGCHDIFRSTRFVVEPGRFLVAECGIYAARVLYAKIGYKRKFLILDGGLHHHYAAAGGIGQAIRRNYEIDAFVLDDDGKASSVFTVAGSLCLPDDILASDLELPAATGEGDILVFFNSGAYAFSASPSRFLSHPAPGEFVVSPSSPARGAG